MQKDIYIAAIGGVIAFTLLLLYAITVIYMIVMVCKFGQKDFNDGVLLVTTTVGGLVSALVISKLAITTPGSAPAISHVGLNASGKQPSWVTITALIYIGVWFFVGLGALIVGPMVNPEINQTLTDIGKTWLGIAVAAGYAYFGIEHNP